MGEIKKVVQEWLLKEEIINKGEIGIFIEAIDKLAIKIDDILNEMQHLAFNKGYKTAIEEVIATLEKQR